MVMILKILLGKAEKVKEGTNSYIDDNLVDETKVMAAEVVGHMGAYGLASKPLEQVKPYHCT